MSAASVVLCAGALQSPVLLLRAAEAQADNAKLKVLRGRPTRSQWVEALQIVAHAERRSGHWLSIEFTPGGAARITEHPLQRHAL